MSEIQYRMLPLPSVFMMEADFPMEHVNTLNTFLDVYPVINYEQYAKHNNLVYEEERLARAFKFWDKPHQFKIS